MDELRRKALKFLESLDENPGVIYTLHFKKPIGTSGYGIARHYTGWAKDLESLERRLEQHRSGQGAAITAYVAGQPDNDFTVVGLRVGDRNAERRLKNQGGAARRCPICKQNH